MKAITKMLRRTMWAKTLTLAALLPGLVLMPVAVQSNPSGASVAHGVIEIDDSVAGHLKINQGSNKAIINWQDFSISEGELTEFLQPGANSVALNRVMSGNPSSLMGTLRANGGVILVNPNGILVGAGGVVDIGGLAVLSTLDIDDQDFLNGGDMRFKGNSAAGVTNLGTITSRGGDVVLLGNFVTNEGTVGAPDGTVAFGAGGEFIVDTIGDSRISVIGAGPGGKNGVTNNGTVNASAVEFKAHGNVYALAIQNTGIVRANGVNRRGGRIILSAAGDGSVGGRIENTGTLRARNADGSGGEILIDGGPGGQVDILGGTVDADGDNGTNGGTITMLGDIINVTGTSKVSADGANGGNIQIGSQTGTSAVTVGPEASVSANGNAGNGGVVQVLGNSSSIITLDGNVSANGTGNGGVVTVAGGTVNQGVNSVISVNGGVKGGSVNMSGAGVVNTLGAINATTSGGTGGQVILNGGTVNSGADSVIDTRGKLRGGKVDIDAVGEANINGAIDASASGGIGGRIDTSGTVVNVGSTATLTASGSKGGGQVNVGGGFQGNDASVRNSQSTVINDGARINVDSTTLGNGGRAVIWSDTSTMFRGDISARAAGFFGNGGLVEVSGKENLIFRGNVNTTAENGNTGLLLLDPTNVTIEDGAGASSGATLTEADVNAALKLNNLLIHTGAPGADVGNITVNSKVRIEWGSPNTAFTIGNPNYAQNFHDLTLLATGDITVNGQIISHGAGNVNLFAGWDGVTGFPTAAVNPAGVVGATADSVPTGRIGIGQLANFGAPVLGTSGNVYINRTTNDQAVQVGSRFGETNAVGNNLVLQVPSEGSDRFAHFGYRATTNNQSGGAGEYGLVNSSTYRMGLGGAGVGSLDLRGTDFGNAVVAAGNSGNINIDVKGSVLMLGEQADDTRKYTQIGHGGSADVRDNDLFTGGTSNEVDHSLINADHSGNITINAGKGRRSVIFLQAGRETAYSRIGHGGLSNPDDVTKSRGSGSFKGDINVRNHDGDIIAQGNPSTGGWAGAAAIGHGGFRNTYLQQSQVGEGGDIGVPEPLDDLRNIDPLLGPRAFDPDMMTANFNPQGFRGNISVRADKGSIVFEAGESSRSHAMIGHGGHENPGNVGLFDSLGRVIERADINVWADNRISFTSPLDNDGQRFVRIGHGGWLSPGNIAGNINVHAGTDIVFKGGTGDGQAAIGHGGVTQTWGSNTLPGTLNVNGDGVRGIQGGMKGDIAVNAGGNITFRSGTGWADRPFSQIGHGGYGNVALSYANSTAAQLGISEADRLLLLRTNTGWNGNISVTAGGAIDFMSGQPDQLGPTQDLSVTANQAFSMIGHGGRESRGNHYGKITVEGNSIRFEAIGGWGANYSATAATPYGGAENRGDTNFVQIGHGGRNSDFETGTDDGGVQERSLGGRTGNVLRDSTIRVTARTGDITFLSPQKATTVAQFANLLTMSGRWNDADEAFYSQRAVHSWAKIGHGGTDGANYSFNGVGGDIFVTASRGAVTFVGSDHVQAYTNDVRNADGTRDPFSSLRSEQNFTHIGHGGVTIRGVKAGAITVNALNSISMNGGTGRIDYAMIGHGGWDADGPGANANDRVGDDVFDGAISVISQNGGVSLIGGNGGLGHTAIEVSDYSWAQIGHGGRSSNGSTNDDNITVRGGGGDVLVLAGHAFRENYSMIGHGGRDSRAQFLSGAIDVFARNNIMIMGTESGYNQATNFGQIGHGGWDTDPNINDNAISAKGIEIKGKITVKAAKGDIILLAGVDNISPESGGARNFDYEGAVVHNSGWAGDTNDPALPGQPSDGYMYAGRGNATNERPNAGGDNNIRAQGGWAQIGHGGQHTNINVVNQDIKVTAGRDLVAVAGEFRDAKVAIGHNSGPDGWGSNQARRRTDISGNIDITVGRDLKMLAGSGDNATVKFGHGGYQTSSDRSRVESPSNWNGDIHLKVGRDALLDASDKDITLTVPTQMVAGGSLLRPALNDTYSGGADYGRVLVGHRDTNDNRASHGNVTTSTGNTYIAVSRNDPSPTGTGKLITQTSAVNPNGVVFSSANNGVSGELRLYMPSGETGPTGHNNYIGEGTVLNGYAYERTPVPNGLRVDEYIATEFTYTTGVDGEPVGAFGTPPEGDYALHNGLGFYAIYYADTPVVPPVPPRPPVKPVLVTVDVVPPVEIITLPIFNYFPFLNLDKFDSFDRDDQAMLGDFLFGLFSVFGLTSNEEDEARNDDGIRVEGDEILEEPSGLFGLGPAQTEEEEAEEEEKSGRYLKMNSTMYGQYWVYDITTGKYSSLREFGIPAIDTTR